MLTPIETIYRGYKFRSRLEARWASFLDALREPWEYEKEGYRVQWFNEPEAYYLPDFWLPRFDAFLEVKGAPPTDAERNLCRALMADKYPVVLAHGVPGDHFLEVFITEACDASGGFVSVSGCFAMHREKDQLVVVLDRGRWCEFFTSDFERPVPRFWNNMDLRGTIDTDAPIIRRAIQRAKQARFEYGAVNA